MADNLARDIDHSDVSTTDAGGHDSNIGRTDWQSDVRGTAERAPIDRDPRESIREDISDAIEEVGENEQADELRSRRERRRDRAAQRVAQESIEPDQDTDRQESRSHTAQPPQSWSKAAKAEWLKVPPHIRAEIHKREGDMMRGASAVHQENEQIKRNVAQFAQEHTQVYGEIDNAIRPYAQTIQNFGKTPGQAVGQLFAWFDSLARDPDAAFPALVQSYRYDGTRLAGNLMRQAGWHIQKTPQGFLVTRNPQAQQQNYQNQLDQRVAAIEQSHQQQQAYQRQQVEAYQRQQEQINDDATERMLNQWAEGREHFNDVRVLMGTLLTPDPQTGQAAVPLKSDGTI